MASSISSLSYRALVHFVVLLEFLDLAVCYNNESIIGNGDFEDLVGYYPAGVLLKSKEKNQKAAVKQWIVEDGAIEVVSSRLLRSSITNSMYAVHLNTPEGPGAVQTTTRSTLIPGQTYLLGFDLAIVPGGPAVKRLLVSLTNCGGSDPRSSISKSFSFTFSEGNGLSRHLIWKPVLSLFTFLGTGRCAVLRFRSLTPGSRGIVVDNVKLSLTSCAGDECEQADMYIDSGSNNRPYSTSKSSLELLVERIMIATETWFRQRFFRRADW